MHEKIFIHKLNFGFLAICSRGTFYNGTSKMCENCPKGTWNNGNFTLKFEACVSCPANMTTTGPGMISEDNCTLCMYCINSYGTYISRIYFCIDLKTSNGSNNFYHHDMSAKLNITLHIKLWVHSLASTYIYCYELLLIVLLVCAWDCYGSLRLCILYFLRSHIFNHWGIHIDVAIPREYFFAMLYHQYLIYSHIYLVYWIWQYRVSVDCSPGWYISGADCLPCDFGFYQPNRHQDSCIACGENLNTSMTGASSKTMCQSKWN